MKAIFTGKQFVPTQWESAEQKAKFANHFIHFIESGFKETLFFDWFYRRLSMTFGHIAHYNSLGFYDTWFSSPGRQAEFIRHTKRFPCYGDPTYTYSDVEKAIIKHLTTKPVKGLNLELF